MKERWWRALKRLLIVPPIVLGVAVVAVMASRRTPPQRAEGEEAPRPVRVVEVPAVAAVPRALGYGHAQPAKVWQAVAEVSGKVTALEPRLQQGALLAGGTVLVRVDPASYKLAVAKAQAEVQGLEAQIRELDQNAANQGASLKIEREALSLAEKELERKRGLLAKKVISESLFEQQQAEVLRQRGKVQSLENALNLMPARRDVLEAQLGTARAQLDTATLDLANTTVTAPFDLRVVDVGVEAAQFVQRGQVLAAAHGTAVAEVAAQFPIERFMMTVRGSFELPPFGERDLGELAEAAGMSAVVRFHAGAVSVTWDARLSRIDSLMDPRTRTVGVIVTVDRPYEKVEVGRRPPLVKGMYCEVEVRGAPRPGTLVVPRAAVHEADGRPLVHVVGQDGRLAFRPVQTGMELGDAVAVTEGIEAGARVVVTDLVPAIEGMRCEARVDPQASRALLAAAKGETPAR
ncbi:MAG: efflux RND transporter periplasmic adaptor subunit [Planctomycetota bacterium]